MSKSFAAEFSITSQIAKTAITKATAKNSTAQNNAIDLMFFIMFFIFYSRAKNQTGTILN